MQNEHFTIRIEKSIVTWAQQEKLNILQWVIFETQKQLDN